jgi:hypothetical protein
LSVGDTLHAMSEAGLTLGANETGNILKVYPAERISPELAAAIKEHKADILRIVREDEKMRRTGLELARIGSLHFILVGSPND